MKFSLISLNTLGTPFFAPRITKRYKKIASLLNTSNATVICLQEIPTYYHLSLFRRALTNYPHVCYQKFLYGPKGGLVIFSKLPLENCAFHEFNTLGKLTNIAFYTRLLRNGILSCQIKDTKTTILTTHLLCDFHFEKAPGNKLYPIVQKQVEDVIDRVKELEKKGQLFLCGDFNIKKHSLLYKQILKETKVTDVFADRDKATYAPSRVPYKFFVAKDAQIDYLFYSGSKRNITLTKKDFVLEKEEKLTNGKPSFLSDHIGLMGTFDIVF